MIKEQHYQELIRTSEDETIKVFCQISDRGTEYLSIDAQYDPLNIALNCILTTMAELRTKRACDLAAKNEALMENLEIVSPSYEEIENNLGLVIAEDLCSEVIKNEALMDEAEASAELTKFFTHKKDE